MKILACHNFYQQAGGEDQVFADENALLRSHGHQVTAFTLHNDCIPDMGRLELARKTLWNSDSAAAVRRIIRSEDPDILYCTNTFPLVSPSVYAAAKEAGVAVLQGLHNFRHICPKAQLTRKDRPCEKCVGKAVAWPGLLHRCYRNSFPASAVVVAMSARYRFTRVATALVDGFVVPTEFVRQKHIQGGLDARRIFVKPNFVAQDTGLGSGAGGYCAFVGRLSPEKGISTMLEAWRRLKSDVMLKIVGDGPLNTEVRAACKADPRLQWLGWQPLPKVLDIVGDATVLVMPSTWYETFGRTIVEAFSKGTPVIASRLGAMAELVTDGRTGLLFSPGNPDELAACVERVFTDTQLRKSMRRQTRSEFEAKYTAEMNYGLMMAIFEQVLATPRTVRQEAYGTSEAVA